VVALAHERPATLSGSWAKTIQVVGCRWADLDLVRGRVDPVSDIGSCQGKVRRICAFSLVHTCVVLPAQRNQHCAAAPNLRWRGSYACAEEEPARVVIALAGRGPGSCRLWRRRRADRRTAARRARSATRSSRPSWSRRWRPHPRTPTHWSTRSMAQHGISRWTVSEIWRAFGLKPWRPDEFKISPIRT
jgi:hypothetical protein